MPLWVTGAPFSRDSMRLNGPSMIIMFWLLLFALLYIVGWRLTLFILVALYVLAIIIRDREFQKVYPKVDFSQVKEGDVIVVCRGGKGGLASDIAELYMYHIFGLLFTGSIFGHVGLVFRDTDGVLKVVDVRLNLDSSDATRHFICTVPEFENEYKGVKYLVPSNTLTVRESERLTQAVHSIAPHIGHCQDCFNPVRLLQTPSNNASRDEMFEFGKKYGYGCAENIAMILRWAELDAPTQRHVLPHHFTCQAESRRCHPQC